MKNLDFLLPGENILDTLCFRAMYKPCRLVLTERRLLVTGHTGAFGPHFTFLRGNMVSGFPLERFDSFVVGTGRRPALFIFFLLLAAAGGVMLFAPWARYYGLVVLTLALVSFISWLYWLRGFLTVSFRSVKVSGLVRLCEAVVFLERVQLAAEAVRAGRSPVEVKAAVLSSGKTCEGERGPGEFSEAWASCEDPGESPDQAAQSPR